MTTRDLPVPGILLGDYPERRAGADRGASALPAWMRAVRDRLDRGAAGRRVLPAFTARFEAARALSVPQLREAARAQGIALRREGFRPEHIGAAFAFIAAACVRELGVRLYETQVIAADIVLSNRLAEMATGEGKTYAVLLAAAAGALAGIPVHVITANDYLAARDAKALRVVYAALGLTVGHTAPTQSPEIRRAAYACDVAYCTAKELAFDYLRDGLARERDPFRQRVSRFVASEGQAPLLRGLCFAIVDEADSILIDEARVPLILSTAVENEQHLRYLEVAIDIARGLAPEVDFVLDHAVRSAALTERGAVQVEAAIAGLPPMWRNRVHREETICNALAALHLYVRDRQYLVRDGKVLIIDETTGRSAPGRAWSRGLHQLIELKEGCAPTAPMVTAAQITYQRLFPRYLRLGGLSGTLCESRAELMTVYGLAVRRVPLRRPDRRVALPARLFGDRAALWDAAAGRAAELTAGGRPVLVGTDSVADSEALSRRLRERGIAHAVLNARHDDTEAQIVARAGARRAVTVATNMAGRGTDIPLGEGVAALGGLHIVSSQLNASRRIDRQLAGRCARQGDPGSAETWIALDAPLFDQWLPRRVHRMLAANSFALPDPLVRGVVAWLQWRAERHHAAVRRRMLRADAAIDRGLAMGGTRE